MQLSDREKAVLEALVELFIRDAGPVSSGQIGSMVGLGVSSATIRNVLHGLEEKGLLLQPHTSAGRVPTRRAWRLYVDSFCRPTRLPERWLRRIRCELTVDPASRDVQDLLERVSRLLAGLSSNVGLGIAVDDHQDAHIDRVEIVLLEGARLLVVVALDDGMVRTCVVPLERQVSSHVLEAAVQILNEIVVDCTPSEARRRLDVALESRRDEAGRIARSVALEGERLFEDRLPTTVHLEGATEIMGEPEFQDPENLRLLVRILDHPEHLEAVLRERGGAGGPSIMIGVESHREELRPFSLVSAPYTIGGGFGFIGILGPVRMRYALAISLVGSVVDRISSLEEPLN
ncbi:MAG: heat-inducible transcriptional repressor HrcA [Candidatus Krumholzibacteriia bacterium]